MEIRQLRYFISVAHNLNFTRAAQECFVVQTTMTHQIAALEKELGVRLFDRTKRSVSLTAEGESFLPNAEDIVRHADESIEIINNMKGNYSGFLRIGYWGNLVRKDLPIVLKKYRESNPEIRVSLKQANVDELLNDLHDGKLDIVFCCGFDVFDDMKWMAYKVLFEDRLFAVLPIGHRLADRKILSADDVKDEPMVTFPGMGAVDLCNRLEKTNGISIVEDHHKSIMMLVEAGYGISLCCERGLYGDSYLSTTVPMDDTVSKVKVCVCWNKDTDSKIVTKVLDEIKRYFEIR